MLSNGNILAPAGTGMIACLARSKRIPVIFAAESYKFVDKVQLDSIVYNELGNHSELIRPETPQEIQNRIEENPISTTDATAGQPKYVPQEYGGYRGGAEPYTLTSNPAAASLDCAILPYQVINLRYDLTSIRHISVIATESGLIPPTSIPVLIRELRLDASTAGGESNDQNNA